MMTMHSEQLYVPYREDDVKAGYTRRSVGYIIADTERKAKVQFAKLKKTPWRKLERQGWMIVPCEIICDERSVYGEEYGS